MFLVVASGIIRSEPPKKLPSVGKSLGESGSDLFHISVPLRNNLSIFWEVGDLTQYAKNLLMEMADPLLLVISMASSFGFKFVSALSNTVPQVGKDGAMGVMLGIAVFGGMKVGVFSGASVLVGMLGFVSVAVRVGFFVEVAFGKTTAV